MAHPINELTIHSLRRLEDLHLPEIGNVNLLVGANNSGKTTVLEAIALFCRPLDPLEWLAVARRRAIKSSRESLLDGVRWLFRQNAADLDDPYYKGEICIEGQGAFPCLEAAARFAGFGADEEEFGSLGYSDREEGSSSPGYEIGDEESTGSIGYVARGADITLSARVPTDRRLEFDASRDEGRVTYGFQLLEDERFITHEPAREPNLPVTTVSPFSHRVEKPLLSRLSEATLTNEKSSVLECVNLIDDEVAALEILSRQGTSPTLWVQHKTLGYAPLSTLGDGVRRVLTMGLALIEAQHGVLLIDEIETAIHKDALARVFRWLMRAAAHFSVQVFATTHSLEAVDAMLMAQRDDLQGVVAFRLPPPGSERPPARFPGQALYELRYESGMEVR
jgi:hypothetical protein